MALGDELFRGRAEELFETLRKDGEKAIDAFIDDRRSEESWLDFKRSSNGGAGPALTDNDRQNLAKAISGFGNSEGGVIVWGVDCSKNPKRGDVASAKFPIDDPKRFVSWLEGAVSKCTMPPHPGVQHFAIEQSTGGKEFAVTHIPESSVAPHQTVDSRLYYMRAGSNFERVPHGVLVGLFGRSPHPALAHNWIFD